MLIKILLKKSVAFLAAALMSNAAYADAFPTRPIKIVVGFSPGGGTDGLARLYAAKMQAVLKTPVIVENKPGALQLIAARSIMSAKPDGYTLWLATSSSIVQAAATRNDIPFDPLKDFSLISRLAEVDSVIYVRSDLPIYTIADLIKAAKERPNELNYGSAGVGSASHLIMEYIKLVTGLQATHIPYKADSEMTRELVGGNLDFAVVGSGSLPSVVNQPRVRAIAVAGKSRLESLPNVPSAVESGVTELQSLGTYVFYGLLGPGGMPPDVIKMLSDASNEVMSMPDVKATLKEVYTRTSPGSSDDLRKQIEAELVPWREVGKMLQSDPRAMQQ
jgi:tripartite-type tricarboxylate transporter receptor subunit TctC